MASRSGYFNRATGKWVDSSGNSQYNEESQPYITRREKLTFTMNVLETNAATGDADQYTGWATGGPYSYRFFIDNDWNQYIEGDLQTAITAGAITEIKIDNLDTTNATPLSTGRIVLTNSSAESEAFDYTSFTLAAGVYTFTVSATATYSYAVDDSADVVDPMLIEVTNANIDKTNEATGILVITMDADNLAFINAANTANAAEITGCLFELQVLDGSGDLVDSIPGDFRCLNLLADDFANPPPGPAADYYTASVSDARYLRQPTAVNDYAIFKANASTQEVFDIRQHTTFGGQAKINFKDDSGSSTLDTILCDGNGMQIQIGSTRDFEISEGGITYFELIAGGATRFNVGQATTGDIRWSGQTNVNAFYCDATTDVVMVGTNTALGSEKFLVSGLTVLDGAVVINESGADVDTRIEGDTNANLFYVDAGNDAVYIGQAAPVGGVTFEVNGGSYFGGALTAGSNAEFRGSVVVNEAATATADFRVEGDADTHLLFCDASTNQVGVGLSSITSGYLLEVDGNLKYNHAHCSMYVSSAGATATITSGTPVNLFANATIADTSAVSGLTPVDFTVDNTGKGIDYSGSTTKNFHVNACISMTGSGSNFVARFYIAKNGTVITNSRIDRKVGTGSDIGALSLCWDLSLANTDSIEIFVDRSDSGQTITASYAVVQVTEL